VNEDGSIETQFYVHYEERDRRNDEWIDRARILEFVPPMSAPVFNTPRQSADSLPLTRSMRRMQEEFSHKQRSYDDMDATTAKLEKQHEEVSLTFMLSISLFREPKLKMFNAPFLDDGIWMFGIILPILIAL
jgi:hypothetical protein